MQIGNLNVHFIGDPHLGRKFETGVPLHRRGEREASVQAQFISELLTPCDLNICVGDIFDKFVVAPEVVLFVVEAYREAMRQRPNTAFVVLRGNHDASRDTDKASSFDLLYELLDGFGMMTVVKDSIFIFDSQPVGAKIGFLPWMPFETAAQMASKLVGQYDCVVGHWDMSDYGGDGHNVIPLPQLQGKTKLVVSGHDHNGKDYEVDGMLIHYTGSMQPYSHGEDAAGQLYVSLTLDELRAAPAEELQNKNVRVLLKPGETLDFEVDCLALTQKRVAADLKEDEGIEIQLDTFDMQAILRRNLVRHGVSETTSQRTMDMYMERKNAD